MYYIVVQARIVAPGESRSQDVFAWVSEDSRIGERRVEWSSGRDPRESARIGWCRYRETVRGRIVRQSRSEHALPPYTGYIRLVYYRIQNVSRISTAARDIPGFRGYSGCHIRFADVTIESVFHSYAVRVGNYHAALPIAIYGAIRYIVKSLFQEAMDDKPELMQHLRRWVAGWVNTFALWKWASPVIDRGSLLCDPL